MFFQGVNICFQFSGEFRQAVPREYHAADVVFLGACGAALAFLNPEDLFSLAVVLLDFPADFAHSLHGDAGGLRKVVGGDVFRAVGRRNPE